MGEVQIVPGQAQEHDRGEQRQPLVAIAERMLAGGISAVASRTRAVWRRPALRQIARAAASCTDTCSASASSRSRAASPSLSCTFIAMAGIVARRFSRPRGHFRAEE